MGHILFSLLVSGCFETYWVEMLMSSFKPDRTRDVYMSPANKCWGIQFLWVRCLRRKSLFWDVIYFCDYIKIPFDKNTAFEVECQYWKKIPSIWSINFRINLGWCRKHTKCYLIQCSNEIYLVELSHVIILRVVIEFN